MAKIVIEYDEDDADSCWKACKDLHAAAEGIRKMRIDRKYFTDTTLAEWSERCDKAGLGKHAPPWKIGLILRAQGYTMSTDAAVHIWSYRRGS